MLFIKAFYISTSVTIAWIQLGDPVLVYGHYSTFHEKGMSFTRL